MADAQVPWSVGALGGAVTDPAWRAKPSWYLVATEDRMIPPPAQPAHSGTINTSGKRLLAPANQQAGQGCTQFGITRRPLAHRSASSGFRTIYLPTAGELGKHGFELLATAQRPHFTVCLERADDRELGSLLAALGSARPNPQYARTDIWREEG